MCYVIALLIVIFIIMIYYFTKSTTRVAPLTQFEPYTDITKRVPPYFYFANPFYFTNGDVPYMYFFYKYPPSVNNKYYVPQNYSTGYYNQALYMITSEEESK
jgi:hypothetical protein